ncbi:MAG TPA: response regulator, partial [Chitinophagaceae bacterium]
FHFSITYRKCSEAQIRLLEPTPVIKNQLGKLNILVAEDNKVNQLLTSGMLEHLGMNVKLADTGNKALQLIEQETFDVVLMDIQMPEKNGFEATRAIRSMENNANRFVPIVALTASTSGSDIAECEAAGMNGHLTKPFTESALYDTISSVLEKTSQQNTSSANQEKMQTETTGKLYDLSLVNELARGNQEFIVNLAKIFIETVPPTAAEMVNACEQKKWEQVGKLAHKLKSTIDTMCISSLKDDIRVIEKNGKDQKNLESIPSLVEKTSSVISSVTAQLKAEFSL